MRIALATCDEARVLDEDLPPLLQAFTGDAEAVCWDDGSVAWPGFDAVLLRSTWDYVPRYAEFVAWCERVSAATRLLNPLPLLRWNTDKHYLADLAAAGLATVPSSFLEPGQHTGANLLALTAGYASGFVVKPSIGAGSKDARRYRSSETGAAVTHADRLLAAGRSVLVQPYLDRVDSAGETALMFFDGVFSHAIRKGPLLRLDADLEAGLFAAEQIEARVADAAELDLAQRVVAAIPGGAPLYARVDLLRDAAGAPCVLELELTEPSLFFPYGAGSAERLVAALRRRLA